jgi:hypothetical protein
MEAIVANAKSSTPSAFPPTDRPLPPFTVTTRDGKVLRSIEEVTEHLLQPDRLSESALAQLLQDLAAGTDSPLQDPKRATSERQIQVHIHDDENLFSLVDDSNRAMFEFEHNCPPSPYRDAVINAVSSLTWAIKGREDTPATAAIRARSLADLLATRAKQAD